MTRKIAAILLFTTLFAFVVLLAIGKISFFGLRPAVKSFLTQEKIVALTFDDGPSPYTPPILDILKKHHVHATFFLVGQDASHFPDLVKREVEEGNEVGNHTWSHPHLVLHGPRFIFNEIQKTQDELFLITGKKPRFFRPPYGQYHLGVLYLARGLGLFPVNWSDTAWDWRRPGAGEIAANILKNLKPGCIILLHDGGEAGGGDRSQTVQALDIVIPEILKRGYRFATISELYQAH